MKNMTYTSLVCLWGLTTLAGCSNSALPSQGTQLKPPEVSVSAVVLEKVTDYEDFPGRLEAVDSIDIRARVTGFLSKVNFTEGSVVQQGAVLFEIDPRSYQAELERTEGIVLQMTGRLKRLESDFERAKKLLPKDAISKETYDQIIGDRTEAEGNLKVAKANQQTATLKLGWTKVQAPLTGRISRRYIDPGNLVKEDDTVLTTIVDWDPIYAYFDVDERTTLRFQKLIREGWSSNKELPVYLGLADEENDSSGDQKGYPRKGTINFADNRVDPDTGTWRLRGKFDNEKSSLAPGLFVRIRLPIGVPYEAKLIPEQALGTDQGQKFVYVVDASNKVSSRQVKVGRAQHGLRVVTEGLEVGEKVIVRGLQRARAGIEVTPVKLEDKETGRQGDK